MLPNIQVEKQHYGEPSMIHFNHPGQMLNATCITIRDTSDQPGSESFPWPISWSILCRDIDSAGAKERRELQLLI